MGSNVVELWDRASQPPDGGDDPPRPPDATPPVDWDAAPFTCLGKSGRRYWFVDASGEILDLSAHELSRWSDLLVLCGQRRDWLVQHFRTYDRAGEPMDWFNTKLAVAAIIAHCAGIDLFDVNEPRRRYGLWAVADGFALHAGRSVLCLRNGRPAYLRDAGFRDYGALWPTLPPKPLPEGVAPAEIGQALERKYASWNWENPHGPALLLGAAAIGMLGSAAPWRAHVCVVGEPGSGKTTLLRVMVAGLCPLTIYKNDYTEPGLRQWLTETAAGVVLDEAESDAHGDDAKMQKVIEMLRRSSSGTGVDSVKGGGDQNARTFTLTTSAILGCVMPPAMTPADETRFTVLTLRPLAKSDEDEESLTAFVRAHGASLWGRVIGNVARCTALFRLLRKRLLARGCDARVADQLGMLAAARWVMVRDADEDPRGAEPDDDVDVPLEIVEPLILQDQDRVADSGPNLALQRLLSTPMDMTGDKLTIGQGLRRLRAAGDELRRLPAAAQLSPAEFDQRSKALDTWNKLSTLLEGHGVKWATSPLKALDGAPAPPIGLYVTVQAHPRLSRAFEGTGWSGQRWGVALARLPGAKGSREAGTVRMAGGKPRCCWVPAATLRDLTE